MPYTYTSSFNTVPCDLVGPALPDSVAAAVTMRLIPGSYSAFGNVVDIGGVTLRSISPVLFFATEADYYAMLAQVGQQGELSTPEYSMPQLAVLQSLSRATRALGTTNETTANAVFVLTP